MNPMLMNPFLFSIELIDFKTRRVAAFRKNLVELAELELKHAKVIVILLACISTDFKYYML